ncbi:MAG: NAD-dependent epimerase/dehydratase family protein [Saccharofermentans sp.]|nr:NAD-dependent epimerase/dehydratase family protein [Saccharofermentans sp.]
MMKVLIVGGNGLIGGAIAKASADAGRDVYVVGRSTPADASSSMHFIQGNWYEDAFAADAVKDGFDVIVDALVFNEEQMRRTARIVDGHCKQLIYISTDSVYVHPASDLSEDQPICDENVKWKYGIDKRKAELYLQMHGGEYSFSWTIIRPTVTFGLTRIPVGFAGKRNTFDLCARMLADKPVIRFDDPKTKHAMCHDSIFGAAVDALFMNESAFGKAYHISDDEAYTYGEVFEAIEKALGCEGKFVFLPADVLKKDYPELYEDMIYDKNPEFTLDNSAIKSVCPDVSFHVELGYVIFKTVEALKKNKREGSEVSEYDLITDHLLLENPDGAGEYLSTLDEEYKGKIRRFVKMEKNNRARQRVRETLRSIKKRIV